MSEALDFSDDDGDFFIDVGEREGFIMLCVGDYEIVLTINDAMQISAKLIESATIAIDNQIPEHLN
jgi:hypothetical protein